MAKRTRARDAAADALAAHAAALRANARALKAAKITEAQAREPAVVAALACLARSVDAGDKLAAALHGKLAEAVAVDRSKSGREARGVRTALQERKHREHVEAVARWLADEATGGRRFPSVNAAVTALVAAAKKGEAPGVPARERTQMLARVFDVPVRVAMAAIKSDQLLVDVQALLSERASMDALRKALAVSGLRANRKRDPYRARRWPVSMPAPPQAAHWQSTESRQ